MNKSKLHKVLLSIAFVLMLGLTPILMACSNESDDKTYNIIMANATIPPMMAVLDAVNNGNETYMWYGRVNTFANVDKLEDVANLVMRETADYGSGVGIKRDAITVMEAKVNQLYNKNKNAKFRFYVTDYGVDVALRVMVYNRVPAKNYKVILLEDGTGSYSAFQNNYGAEGSINTFNDNLDIVNTKYEKAWKREADAFDPNFGNIQNWAQSFAYATRENVEYWLQFPEMLSSQDEDIQALLNPESTVKINFVKKNLSNIYASMSVEKQSLFKSMLINEEITSAMEFNNNKPNLMVLGTSFGGEQMGVTSANQELTATNDETFTLSDKGYNQMFEAVFDYIVYAYGDTFNIVLKPHPAWTPSLKNPGSKWGLEGTTQSDLVQRVNYLENNNITVLPGQTPAEAIMWAYPNLYLCGYNSSTYMNEQNGKTLFFIDKENASQLSSPVNTLVQNGSIYAGMAFNPATQKYSKVQPQFITKQIIIDWLATQPNVQQ